MNLFIDTHTHLDGEEFREDIDEVVQRAKDAGAIKLFLPCINLDSIPTMQVLCNRYPGFIYQMIGLHPEDVKSDWQEVLSKMYAILKAPPQPSQVMSVDSQSLSDKGLFPSESSGVGTYIAIGEVGLDYYWSREFEKEQLAVFERQVEWSIETGFPLMIHCRKAQNEMVHILRNYEKELPGGVFHCFTGNQHEALELLQFEKFVLGVGGVSTFKKSHLPEDLPAAVPLSRLVLETDSPYMAPVPHRGERNESSFVPFVIARLAEAYKVSEEEICNATNANVKRVFPLAF